MRWHISSMYKWRHVARKCLCWMWKTTDFFFMSCIIHEVPLHLRWTSSWMTGSLSQSVLTLFGVEKCFIVVTHSVKQHHKLRPPKRHKAESTKPQRTSNKHSYHNLENWSCRIKQLIYKNNKDIFLVLYNPTDYDFMFFDICILFMAEIVTLNML